MNAKGSNAEMSQDEEQMLRRGRWGVAVAVLIGGGIWLAWPVENEPMIPEGAIQESLDNHSRNLEEDWLFQERKWADASVDEARRDLRLARTAQDIALAEDELRTARAKLERIEEKLDRLDE